MSDVNEPQRPTPAESSADSAEPTPEFGRVPPEPAYVTEGALIPATGPIGEIRKTGTCVLLTVVTLGFYSWYWYYKTHDEMKRHTGDGLGGGIALLLAILVGIVMPFLNSHEVGKLYERRGQAQPVSAVTGLWFLLLGWFFFVGAIVWFVKTNRALNDYWESQGAS